MQRAGGGWEGRCQGEGHRSGRAGPGRIAGGGSEGSARAECLCVCGGGAWGQGRRWTRGTARRRGGTWPAPPSTTPPSPSRPGPVSRRPAARQPGGPGRQRRAGGSRCGPGTWWAGKAVRADIIRVACPSQQSESLNRVTYPSHSFKSPIRVAVLSCPPRPPCARRAHPSRAPRRRAEVYPARGPGAAVPAPTPSCAGPGPVREPERSGVL